MKREPIPAASNCVDPGSTRQAGPLAAAGRFGVTARTAVLGSGPLIECLYPEAV
jgi:hypothetical protein